MKTVMAVAFLAFSVTITAALPAHATFTISVKSSSDPLRVAPSIKLTSTEPGAIGGWKIKYYFYEPDLPWTPPAATGISPAGTTVNIWPLDRTYTGSTSGRGGPTQMATHVAAVTIPANTNITAGGSITLSFNLVAKTARPAGGAWKDWSRGTDDTVNFAPNTDVALLTANGNIPAYGTPPPGNGSIAISQARDKIKHVIVIMQENRSFDNYFGTFPNPSGTVVDPLGNVIPGVDGVSKAPSGGTTRNSPCSTTVTWNPSTLTATDATSFADDLPHDMNYAKPSLGCGTQFPAPNRSCDSRCGAFPCWEGDPLNISDFLGATYAYRGNTCGTASDAAFKQTAGHYQGWPSTSTTTHDVLWNYWTFAQNFMLQDRMFTPIPAWSRLTHLFMVSGWSVDDCGTSAPCPALDPNHTGNPDYPTDYLDVNTGTFAWKEISTALTNKGVSWAYYRGDDWNPRNNSSTDRCTCNSTLNSANNYGNCFKTGQGNAVQGIWNPLPLFKDVQASKGTNWQGDGLKTFLDAVNKGCGTTGGCIDDGSLPKVSWIVPGLYTSEHPAYSFTSAGTSHSADPRAGQAYVTMILQQIMKNKPLWESSVVYVAWDDWGGYYDHARPPRDGIKLMYGPRAPAFVVSPWLGIGKLDHQTLSFDAYLKFIEDLWLTDSNCGTQRVGMVPAPYPTCWTNADRRPTPVRENMSVLGNLVNEFDFYKVLKPAPTPVTGLSCNFPPVP